MPEIFDAWDPVADSLSNLDEIVGAARTGGRLAAAPQAFAIDMGRALLDPSGAPDELDALVFQPRAVL
jgi:hypothetical protein